MLTRLRSQFTGAYTTKNPEVMGCILDTELLSPNPNQQNKQASKT